MQLKTLVQDCLYVNWALPSERLPRLPAPLRYDLHAVDGGGQCGFVSALLFRQKGLRMTAVPWMKLTYPQLNLRFYVLDDHGEPSVFFGTMMVPPWVAPLARVAGQPFFGPGLLDYPRPSRQREAPSWRWRATARGTLLLAARQAAPRAQPQPAIGSWESTCDYFRRRDRGYVRAGAGLRRIETTHAPTTLWPMAVDVHRDSLLRRLLDFPAGEPLPEVHSAWLCPEMPLHFSLAPVGRGALPRGVPAPG